MSAGDDGTDETQVESFNPWSVVNLVFTHLSDQGLHPVLGESGDPGPPARALLARARHRACGRGQPRRDARRPGRTSPRSEPRFDDG